MANKKSTSINKLINTAIFMFSIFKLVPNLFALIEMEARAAKKSLASLLFIYLIAASLLTSLWLSILAMGFIYLISLQLSHLQAIFIIVFINLLLLIVTMLIAANTKKGLGFAKTRQIVRSICRR